jgi:hypothetical protein
LTLLVIYECLNILKNVLALMAMLISTGHSQKRPPLRAWILFGFLPRFLLF